MEPQPSSTTGMTPTAGTLAPNCRVYQLTVAIESAVLAMSLLGLLLFCYIRPKRWIKKAAASRDGEFAEMKKQMDNKDKKTAAVLQAAI